MTMRVRLPNGNSVVIPPTATLASVAQLLVQNGCIDGFRYGHTDGKEYKITHRGGYPVLVPFTPYLPPVL